MHRCPLNPIPKSVDSPLLKEVIFLPAPHRRSLYRVLHKPGEPPHVNTPNDLEEAVMEAVADDEVQAGDDHA